MSEEQFEAWGRRVAAAHASRPQAPAPWVREAALSEAEPITTPRWRAPVFACAAVLLVIVVAIWLRPSHGAALQYEIEGEAGAIARIVTAPADAPRAVHFNEGTTVRVQPGSVARIDALEHDAPKLSLLNGSGAFDVAHADGRTWWVHAGPYRVEVVGTKFDLSWAPQHERLAMQMHEGVVRVHGPGMDAHVTVRAGQSFAVSGGPVAPDADGAVVAPERAIGVAPVAATSTPATVPPMGADSAETPAAEPPDRPAPPSTSKRTPAAPPAWRALADAGDYKAAYAKAAAGDWSSTLRTASASALLDLADVARLAGHVDEAQAALLQLRARFPKRKQAALAAYTLGRLFADHRRKPAKAAEWFGRYLAEAPRGTLVQEAMGRYFETLHKAGRERDAAEAARRYLDRFPSGARAALARSITGPARAGKP